MAGHHRPGGRVGNDPLATRRQESIPLEIQVLLDGGDPRVADLHGRGPSFVRKVVMKKNNLP